jgi:hypothetical protein
MPMAAQKGRAVISPTSTSPRDIVMLLDAPRLEVSLTQSLKRLTAMLHRPFSLLRNTIYYVSFRQSPLPLPLF